MKTIFLLLIAFSSEASVTGVWKTFSIDPEFPFSMHSASWMLFPSENELVTVYQIGRQHMTSKYESQWLDSSTVLYSNENSSFLGYVTQNNKNEIMFCVKNGGCKTYQKVSEADHWRAGFHPVPQADLNIVIHSSNGDIHFQSDISEVFPDAYESVYPASKTLSLPSTVSKIYDYELTVYLYLGESNGQEVSDYLGSYTLWKKEKKQDESHWRRVAGSIQAQFLSSDLDSIVDEVDQDIKEIEIQWIKH
ncbi:MAG: hypothetical protein CL678_00200 [Bdellovibrionaceae bacterium]|nr:hypothetical protein [Pseudobdellovibrionaceae bacterium]|tara:strand:- start:244 stop:990 length:747 start_codon:yes stop_codon:yes gene_type:complete